MRIAYLDCFSGISGDMFLAALVDAGVPPSLFEQTVAALNAAAPLDARLEIRRVERSGISSTKVDVCVGSEKDEPRTEVSHHQHDSHDHNHPHPHEHEHGHSHSRTGAHSTRPPRRARSGQATSTIIHMHSRGRLCHRMVMRIAG